MNIYIPSIKKEYKNKSLTFEIIGFAALICLFIVPIFVILGQDLLKDSYGILFTYISLNTILTIIITVTFLMILSIFYIKSYIDKMTTSYIIDEGTIVKAKLKSNKKLFTLYNLIYNGFSIATLKSINLENEKINKNLFNFYKLIKIRVYLNQQLIFVKEFINTDFYDKKTFTNVKLKFENKKSLIYSTDNGTLKIPNFYSNEDRAKDNSFNKYFNRRIVVWTLIIFMFFNLLSWSDLYYHSKIDDKYIALMDKTDEKIYKNVTKYSFTQVLNFKQTEYYPTNINTIFEFDKYRLNYNIDKEGKISDSKISYYHTNYETYAVEKFANILMTLNPNYSIEDYDVDTFIKTFNLEDAAKNLLEIQKGKMDSYEFSLFKYYILIERKDDKVLVYTK